MRKLMAIEIDTLQLGLQQAVTQDTFRAITERMYAQPEATRRRLRCQGIQFLERYLAARRHQLAQPAVEPSRTIDASEQAHQGLLALGTYMEKAVDPLVAVRD